MFTITLAGRDVAQLRPTSRGTWVSGPALKAVWRTPARRTIGADLERFPAGSSIHSRELLRAVLDT